MDRSPHVYKAIYIYILYNAKQRLCWWSEKGESWAVAKTRLFAPWKARLSWSLGEEGLGTLAEGCEGKILVN